MIPISLLRWELTGRREHGGVDSAGPAPWTDPVVRAAVPETDPRNAPRCLADFAVSTVEGGRYRTPQRDLKSLLFSSMMNSETTLDLPAAIRDLWTGRLPIVHKLFISRFTVRFPRGVLR